MINNSRTQAQIHHQQQQHQNRYAQNQSYLNRSNFVEKGLDIKMRKHVLRNCVKWGCFNAFVLALVLIDVSNKCPYTYSKWFYLEFFIMAITIVSIISYFCKYCYYTLTFSPLQGTSAQKDLLKFDETDKTFLVTTKEEKPIEVKNLNMNATLLSWHSSFSNDSGRCMTPFRTTPGRTSLNNSWNSSFDKSSLNVSSSKSPFTSPYSKCSRTDDAMIDERELQAYLSNISKRKQSVDDISQSMFNNTTFNSFWFYCNTAASLLKSSLYQLAPSAPKTLSSQHNKDEGGCINSDLDTNSEIIKKIPSAKLSKYVTNLRMWIAITILHRLEHEINKTDKIFQSSGSTEMKIGAMGLERLKKTAENQQFVNIHVPLLPLIIPFLEISPNQEYLVQRIKDLAKGSCIANYQSNTGVSYQGLKWDSNLPTDASILFHLFCTYFDANLLPLPGRRPFFDRYVIVGDKKSAQETLKNHPIKNKSGCAILVSNTLDPKFNFVNDNIIHKCAYDRNNLFYVIIQFLFYIKNLHDGVLEGINLGKSGINILCIIDE